jgi:DNA transformation protein
MLPRRVSLNALYALEAALRGCHWLDLPQDVKSALQQQAKTIDESFRRGAAARCAIG